MITAVAIACSAAYSALLAVKSEFALRYAESAPKYPPVGFTEVTVLQPVVSGDPRLGEILGAGLQALPAAEFLWLGDEDDTHARDLCARLQRVFPTARARFVPIPPPPPGQNPKLHKLAFVESQLRSRYVMVLDDDTAPTATAGAALLGALADCDLATGLPFYLDGQGTGTRLVTQFVNNQAIFTYLPLLRFHPPITINGMFYALETSRLRALGGFAPQTHHVTDDFAMARLIINAGGRIHQTVEVHFIATTVRGTRHYVQLMHRWFVFATLLLRAQPPRWRLAIVGLHGLPPMLLWIAIIMTLLAPRWSSMAVLAAMLITRSVLVSRAQRRIAGRSSHAPLISLLAELLQPFHLIHGFCQRTILWRKRRIRVRADDDFDYV